MPKKRHTHRGRHRGQPWKTGPSPDTIIAHCRLNLRDHGGFTLADEVKETIKELLESKRGEK
jgi:hypothetical protein